MPKASKETASEHETVEGYEGHFEHFDGGWTVGVRDLHRRTPTCAPFFKGLPNDECQCEHMGYVIKGKVAFRSGDREEVFEAGDAYYVGPGAHPGALRRHRGRRVQPDRGARPRRWRS